MFFLGDVLEFCVFFAFLMDSFIFTVLKYQKMRFCFFDELQKREVCL